MIRTPSVWLLWGTLLGSLVFALLPLPASVAPLRPYLLALLLAYWVMEAPHRVGLGKAFLLGLLADVATATPLGEQALRLVVITFLVTRFRARLRFFPLWQQALAIGLMLFNDRVIVSLLRLASGNPQEMWSSWLAPVIAMLLWPWLFVLLDMARLRSRSQG